MSEEQKKLIEQVTSEAKELDKINLKLAVATMQVLNLSQSAHKEEEDAKNLIES